MISLLWLCFALLVAAAAAILLLWCSTSLSLLLSL